MKTYIISGSFVAAIIIALVAMIQEEWQLAIWIILILILSELGQIHNTIKSLSKEKE